VAEEVVLDEDLIIAGENAIALAALPAGAFDLIYLDPPFNTGRAQARHTLAVAADGAGERVGFGGRRYRSRLLQSLSYDDTFADYLGFLEPRLVQARALLAEHGTLYFHIDYREAHYCKLLLDEIFGRDCFLNELIWAYDYGAKPRRRWPAKHDTILVYVRTPGAHHFDADAVEREPYMAPGLVSAAKAARGKRPTDVWFHTIVPTNGREKTGYPTQKPEGVLRRIVAASSRPGGWCLDPFAGSGTLGAVCRQLGRRFVMVDCSPVAIEVMRTRLAQSPLESPVPPAVRQARRAGLSHP
jgi:site-specific DNA-methyltransferase (adenine-specific)